MELFDLDTDMCESNDLSSRHVALALQMKRPLIEWQCDVAAKMSKPNPDWST